MSVRLLRLGLLTFLSGCASSPVGQEETELARKFFQLPVTEQLRTYRQFALHEQLDIYLFGNQVRHPPALYLGKL